MNLRQITQKYFFSAFDFYYFLLASFPYCHHFHSIKMKQRKKDLQLYKI